MATTCQQCGLRAATGAVTCRQCGSALPDDGFVPPPPGATGWGSNPASDPGPGGDPSWGSGPPAAPPSRDSDSDARNLSLLAHLSAFVGFFGVPPFVGPLVVWLWKRDGHPFIAEHAAEALNFNLSVFIYGIVGTIVAVVLGLATLGLGLFVIVPVAIALGIAYLVLVVIAALAASRGERYRYPLTIRFVR